MKRYILMIFVLTHTLGLAQNKAEGEPLKLVLGKRYSERYDEWLKAHIVKCTEANSSESFKKHYWQLWAAEPKFYEFDGTLTQIFYQISSKIRDKREVHEWEKETLNELIKFLEKVASLDGNDKDLLTMKRTIVASTSGGYYWPQLSNEQVDAMLKRYIEFLLNYKKQISKP